MNVGPWDVVRDLLSLQSFRAMSFTDKIDLYYQDYQLIPLMVQENYHRVVPSVISQSNLTPKQKELETLKALSRSADAIADSDIVDRSVRT